jgi:hypothetical protein
MLHVWMIETFTPNMTKSNGKHTPAPWVLGNQMSKWSILKIWSWNHQIQISPTYYPIDPHAVGHTLLYSSVSIACPPFSSIILQVINLHWSSGIPKPRWHRRVSPYFGSPSYIPGSFELNESVAELRSDWSSHFGLWLAGKFSINEIQLNYVKL